MNRDEDKRRPEMESLLANAGALRRHVMNVLNEAGNRGRVFPRGISGAASTSAVLFLLGERRSYGGSVPEPCIILNKRSLMVKQPGDLCFPGGRVSPRLDRHLSTLLVLPFLTLGRWPLWPRWRNRRPGEARRLALLLATSLREGLEEMGLNPFGIRFLGPMPSHALVWFDRVIYPMVGWVSRQRHFVTNWEVEKIVHIPFRNLLRPNDYACYRLSTKTGHVGNGGVRDFPCFVNQDKGGEEILWGATFRIVLDFLELVFAFKPPHMASLRVVHGELNERYFNGAG